MARVVVGGGVAGMLFSGTRRRRLGQKEPNSVLSHDHFGYKMQTSTFSFHHHSSLSNEQTKYIEITVTWPCYATAVGYLL